jgi:hypothetical protein
MVKTSYVKWIVFKEFASWSAVYILTKTGRMVTPRLYWHRAVMNISDLSTCWYNCHGYQTYGTIYNDSETRWYFTGERMCNVDMFDVEYCDNYIQLYETGHVLSVPFRDTHISRSAQWSKLNSCNLSINCQFILITTRHHQNPILIMSAVSHPDEWRHTVGALIGSMGRV